jgi:hypothetical protein
MAAQRKPRSTSVPTDNDFRAPEAPAPFSGRARIETSCVCCALSDNGSNLSNKDWSMTGQCARGVSSLPPAVRQSQRARRARHDRSPADAAAGELCSFCSSGRPAPADSKDLRDRNIERTQSPQEPWRFRHDIDAKEPRMEPAVSRVQSPGGSGAGEGRRLRRPGQRSPGMVAGIRGSAIATTLGSAVRNSSKRASPRGRA